MAVSATTKEVKPSATKISKPLVTGLTKAPPSQRPVNTASKVPANAASQRPFPPALTRKVPVTAAKTRKFPVTRTSSKAQAASSLKTKATGVPKTSASGTPTGRGTGQQHQQPSGSLTVPGTGQQRQGHGQPIRPPPSQAGWDVTEYGWFEGGKVPQAFLENQIQKVFVEFLRVGDNPQAKNHVAFKIDFEPGPDGHWPGDYKGVRLHMEVDDGVETKNYNGAPYQPGTLLMKPVEYPDKSNNSVRTFQLHRGHYTLKLRDILYLIVNHYQLGLFYFQILNDRYYGCRDFITQAIRILEHEKYISSTIADVKPATPPLTGFTSIYQALRCRFRLHDAEMAGMDGGYDACPVDKGYFDPPHQRIGGNEMPYI